MTLRAGCTSPPHRHGNCEEMIFARSGTVELIVEGRRQALRAGEAARVPRGSVHHLEAGVADASMFVVWSAAHRDYEPVPPGA
jgi:quercetin dioxygenase-like cupin family protein